MDIRRADGKKEPLPVGGKELGRITITILVDTIQWSFEFAGAFTVSGLRDPVFALRTEDVGGTPMQRVVRDRGGEDDATLGLAAFVHIFHEKLPWLAGTFGLGINEGNKTSYFLGPSWRLGDKAALTAGYVWGSEDRLPGGVEVGDFVTDANVLNSLASRIGGAGFFAISYTFINPRQRLEKPFAGGQQGTQSSPSP